MPHWWTFLPLLAMSCSLSVTSPWYRYVYQEYQVPSSQYDHHPHECNHHNKHDYYHQGNNQHHQGNDQYHQGNYQHHQGNDQHHQGNDQHHQGNNQHHHGNDQHQQDGAGRGEYGGYDQNGCACLFYVESTLVSRSQNNSLWHSCDVWGLNECGQYCDQLFQDENARFRILQNACDTLGREIVHPLYRRHQVCGQYGPYEDFLLPDDLCCRRGRPSDSC